MINSPEGDSGRLPAGLDERFRPFGNMHILENMGPLPRIILVVGVGVSVNILLVGVYLFLSDEVPAGVTALGVALVASVAAAVCWSTGSSLTMGAAQISVGIIGVVTIHVLLGGYSWSGGWLAWGLSHVTIVALFFPRWAALAVLTFYTVASVVFIPLEPFLQRARGEPPGVYVPAVLAADTMVVNLVLLTVLAILLVGLLGREQRRNLDLLKMVLPASIARRLKESPGVIADRFEECSVLFADLVGFTSHSTQVSPERLVTELNEVFSGFDDLVGRHGAEKIKTIGDGYMAVAGAPSRVEGHAAVMCHLAIDMQDTMNSVNRSLGTSFRLRVGVNTGQVVAGVIGTDRFSYDLWGDTVNTASRLEKLAEPGEIMVSAPVTISAGDHFRFQSRGVVDLRGRGATAVYLLVGRRAINPPGPPRLRAP